MENAVNKNEKRKAALKWIFIIAVNVAITVLVVLSSVFYAVKQNNTRYDEKEQGFTSALDAMGQTAYSDLHIEQVFCDNWATYINNNHAKGKTLNLTEVGNFINQVNSDTERVTMHVVDYVTYEGYHFGKDSNETPALEEVNYNPVKEKVEAVFTEAKACTKSESHLHISKPFAIGDGETSLGFCHNITIRDSDGEIKDKVLVRIVSVTEFYGKWLPPSFNKAKLALADRDGDFIVHFNSIDHSKAQVEEDNFFDYLKNNTDAERAAVNKFESDFASFNGNDNYKDDLSCLDGNGQESYFSVHRLANNEQWVLIGYILREDLNVTNLDTTLAIIVIVGFLILMLIDGAYIVIMNKHLKTSLEDIKYANEAKTRFLSTMSHDIRTPMNAIIGMTTIAAKRIDDKKQVEECLHQITRASNHLLTLINDVLDISKVESGKLSLNPTVFSLAELMGNIISISQPNIKEKEMQFEIHARKVKYEYIFADELRLNQILINLISNAIKYTPEKGKVSLELEEQPSEKGQNAVRLIFKVSDTGIGISEEFMKNMYDTFTRDIDSRINTIQGAGLGLAITKQMVDLMEGTIDAKSKLGEGTTFTVTLDLPIAEKMTDELILPPLRLLVVDDDELFLESAEDTLKSLGLEADTVSNGADAVNLVEENHFKNNDYHCVIVDWQMPNMNGLETVKAIREKVGDDVSVVIISAYDWTEIEEEALKAGANGFISKPLFRSSVYKTLNDVLNLDHKKQPTKEEENEDLKGLKLLIAEDNDVNWEIISVMLEFNGINSERAENGQICVDKINAAPEGTYDAILMDIQMPVMNGKDATRAIRSSDKEYVKNIPVIAMTADAFAEDIAACKEAGMNGHVAKPLDMQKLIKELRSALHLRDE